MSEYLDSFVIPSTPAPSEDRWLYAWGLAYTAVGAASLLVPLYAMVLGGDALLVGLPADTGAVADVPGGFVAGRVATEPSNRWPALAGTLGAILLSLAALALFAEMLVTASGSTVGGTLALWVGYGALFLVAVVVVIVGAGLSLLAW